MAGPSQILASGGLRGLAGAHDSPATVREVFSLLRRVEQVLTQLDVGRRPGLSSERVTSVALTTSATKVKHKLGRAPIGWRLTDKNADARVWRSAASDASYLTLTASAAVTVDLEVF